VSIFLAEREQQAMRESTRGGLQIFPKLEVRWMLTSKDEVLTNQRNSAGWPRASAALLEGRYARLQPGEDEVGDARKYAG
jgi:hypothetical protein